jgi:hypothetical protein
MPKKKKPESQAEQSARFRAEVARLIEAGELSPTEADDVVARLVSRAAIKQAPSSN